MDDAATAAAPTTIALAACTPTAIGDNQAGVPTSTANATKRTAATAAAAAEEEHKEGVVNDEPKAQPKWRRSGRLSLST
ncbi:hypothetical protein H9P43_008043 [Blastocladiella emersonii ATCC 22665]|nr:hypothetical protein H9P43_008043 [Blastocladiella emersonii ATCC 22665]